MAVLLTTLSSLELMQLTYYNYSC